MRLSKLLPIKWNKCDVCGRLIGYNDLEKGLAIRRMITPDSDVSEKSWETLCNKHNISNPNNEIPKTKVLI